MATKPLKKSAIISITPTISTRLLLSKRRAMLQNILRQGAETEQHYLWACCFLCAAFNVQELNELTHDNVTEAAMRANDYLQGAWKLWA